MGKIKETKKSHSKPKAKPEASSTLYNHDRWGTEPKDIVRSFTAHAVFFDFKGNNDEDGKGEVCEVPEWVALNG